MFTDSGDDDCCYDDDADELSSLPPDDLIQESPGFVEESDRGSTPSPPSVASNVVAVDKAGKRASSGKTKNGRNAKRANVGVAISDFVNNQKDQPSTAMMMMMMMNQMEQRQQQQQMFLAALFGRGSFASDGPFANSSRDSTGNATAGDATGDATTGNATTGNATTSTTATGNDDD